MLSILVNLKVEDAFIITKICIIYSKDESLGIICWNDER